MRRYALAIGPLLAGVALALLWQAGLWANPILYLRADVGTLLFLVGAGASALCTLGMALWAQAGRCHERKTFMLRQEQAESHRRFVRRLDHELKNPLTAIRIGLANLSGQCDGATMASLRAQVDRLAHLTADLRKLADLEMQPLELEPVDLGQLLTEVVESAQERPERQSRHLELSLPRAPWPLPPVAGDRDLLFLAVHNLLDNALKFSRPGDTIEVRAFEGNGCVMVEVADTGPGVPEDEVAHLGEELYRGSAARAVEGSGLGLALARAIIARHGGALALRSKPGQGTLVSVRIPTAT